MEQKQLNDLVYVQYNLQLRRNQLLNKRPNTNPIVLEDIDPTSYWVVESHPTEFDYDNYIGIDLDLQMKALVEHNVQLNADPLVLGPAPSPSITDTSSTQPRRKRISRLSQHAVVVPASATTSTVGDGDEEEEPWISLSDSDSEFEPDDVGFSSEVLQFTFVVETI